MTGAMTKTCLRSVTGEWARAGPRACRAARRPLRDRPPGVHPAAQRAAPRGAV